MAKELVSLKLRDMYAIKHALQNIVRQKNERLEKLCTSDMSSYGPEEFEEMDRLDKDMSHEKALIKKFEEEINEFKDKYRLLSNK